MGNTIALKFFHEKSFWQWPGVKIRGKVKVQLDTKADGLFLLLCASKWYLYI